MDKVSTIGAIYLVYKYLGKPCLLLSCEICSHRMLHWMDGHKSANWTIYLDQFVQASFSVIWSFEGVTYPLIFIHPWLWLPWLLGPPNVEKAKGSREETRNLWYN